MAAKPKASDFFHFYQVKEHDKWRSIQDTLLPKLLEKDPPFLVTVLSVSDIEPTEKSKYKGDLYLDWDGEIVDALRDAKRLITSLVEDLSLDPEVMKIYLTGGRGVHLEIPYQVFNPKIDQGLENLPLLYREMVNQFGMTAGLTVDFNIYSMGKGRMWRTPNVKRQNGKYKVQIGYQDFINIEPETYGAYCSEPKPALPAPTDLEPCFGLVSVWNSAVAQVSSKLSSRNPTTRAEAERFQTLAAELPLAAITLLAGSEINEAVGLNAIALQLGLFAQNLGIKEAEYLAGLKDWATLRSQQAQGKSHKTATEILNELKRVFRYLDNNRLMIFSVSGLRSILTPEGARILQELMLKAQGYAQADDTLETDDTKQIDDYSDLAQQITSSFGRTLMMEKGDKGGVKGALFPAEVQASSVIAYTGSTEEHNKEQYISFQYRTKDNVWKVCEAFIPSQHAQNAQSFGSFCTGLLGLSYPQVCDGTQFYNYLLGLARANGYGVDDKIQLNVEGVHVIIPAEEHEEGIVDYTSAYLVYVGQGRMKSYVAPEFINHFNTHYQTNAPENKNFGSLKVLGTSVLTDEDEKLIGNLLNLNGSGFFMGCILGWSMTAIARDAFTLLNGNFPILMLVGQAGAGKSETAKLLLALFHHEEGQLINAGGATAAGLQLSLESSMSYPTILDEFKPSDISKEKKEGLSNLFNIAFGRKSTVTRAGAQSTRNNGWRNQDKLSYNAPLMVLGETLMQDSSHRERVVFATALKTGTYGRQGQLDYLNEYKHRLHRLGAAVVKNYLTMTVKDIQRLVQKNRNSLTERFIGTPTRVLTNTATVLTGLDMLGDTLHKRYGSKFDDKIQMLKDEVSNPINHTNRTVTSESTQALRVLFQAAAAKGIAADWLRGKHYCISSDTQAMDIDISLTFPIYLANAQQQQRVHYSSTESLFAGLKTDEFCLEFDQSTSPLYKSGCEKILRFHYQALVNALNISLT